MKMQQGIARTIRLLLIASLIVIAVFPLFWMINTSLSPTSVLFEDSPRFIPDFSQFSTYFEVFSVMPISSWLWNSFLIAGGTTLVTLALALFAAYAMSRHRFYGRGVFGFVLFATQMLPEALLVVPLYGLFLAFGLMNELYGLVLVNAAFVTPIVTWLLKGAIDALPVEIEEAARIDGCGTLRMQRSVVWPLIAPTVAVGSILAFFHAWNEYLLALTFIQDDSKRPAAVGLATQVGELGTPLELVMAGAVLYALPALLFFIAAQKRIAAGLTMGGVKG